MTCKDCINYDWCKDQTGNTDYYNGLSVENRCKGFKDKSQYIKLPCKVGDTVYTNFSVVGDYLREKDKPYACKIVFIGINESDDFGGGFVNAEFKNGRMWQFKFLDIGKTVFLDKESAEKALRECEKHV